MNAWIVKLFIVEVTGTEDKDVKAKAEFLGLGEDNTVKADFQDSDLATFWQKAGLEYFILSNRVLKLLIPFATMYYCEADFCTVGQQ
jgi:hypothetical protein